MCDKMIGCTPFVPWFSEVVLLHCVPLQQLLLWKALQQTLGALVALTFVSCDTSKTGKCKITDLRVLSVICQIRDSQ